MKRPATSNSAPLRVCCFPLTLKENAVLDILYESMKPDAFRLTGYRWFWSVFDKTDIFHVHWPDAVLMGHSRWRSLLKFIAFFVTVEIFRLRHVSIVYSVHNVGSHEARFPVFERAFWAWFLSRVDAFIHMNSRSQALLASMGRFSSNALNVVIPHPHYRSTRRGTLDRTTARKQLGLEPDAYVLLSIGLVRPYKGLERLLEAFQTYADPKAILIIAGRPVDDAYAKSIWDQANRDSRVHLDMRFIPQDEIEAYLVACDQIILSHHKLNNSGVAILALSYDRSLIAPESGAILDLRDQTGPAWITTFGSEGLTSATIERARVNHTTLPSPAQPDLSPYDPPRIAKAIEEVYDSLMSASSAV